MNAKFQQRRAERRAQAGYDLLCLLIKWALFALVIVKWCEVPGVS